jgi:K+-sensing histidine kinase KdpD
VLGDSQFLRIVVENVLNNAWKYTSKHPLARIEFGKAH